MSTGFTKEELAYLAALETLNDVLDYIGSLLLTDIGRNNRALLSEIATRLDVPTDAVALIYIRREKGHANIYHWAVYEPEKVRALKAHPARKWNMTVMANQFIMPPDDCEAFFAFNNAYFHQTAIIDKGCNRIEKGQAEAAWSTEPLYELSGEAYTVHVADVLEEMRAMRPYDVPLRIAMLGECDSRYRTRFGHGMKIHEETGIITAFATRHPVLLFRVNVSGGQLRYLAYSAAEESLFEVYFGEQTDTRSVIARFKETQQRLAHPLLEADREALEALGLVPAKGP